MRYANEKGLNYVVVGDFGDEFYSLPKSTEKALLKRTRLCPNAKIIEGLTINGDNAATCNKVLEKWLKKIGLKR